MVLEELRKAHSYLSQLRKGYLVRKRVRVWAIMLCTFHFIYGFGLLVDPERFRTGEIYAAIQRVASLDFWALGFLTPAALFFVAAITRKFYVWTLAMFFSLIVTLTWFWCLIIARIDGAPLTSGGIALWVWFLFTNVMVATVPNQIEPFPQSDLEVTS